MISLVCTNYENSENYQSLKISWDANAKTQINIPYVHANWFNMPKYMLGLDMFMLIKCMQVLTLNGPRYLDLGKHKWSAWF